MANDILTQDYLKSIFEYRDGHLYWKINKPKVYIGMKAGSIKTDGYKKVVINYKDYLLHRIIFLYHHGFIPQFVDHINGNRCDNHIENLREATRSENGVNAKLRIDNTTGKKNIYWNKKVKKWMVLVRVNNKSKYFGLYEDIELAELVAIEAREKHHGNFANHG